MMMVKPAAGRLDQMKKQIKTNNYEERNGVIVILFLFSGIINPRLPDSTDSGKNSYGLKEVSFIETCTF